MITFFCLMVGAFLVSGVVASINHNLTINGKGYNGNRWKPVTSPTT